MCVMILWEVGTSQCQMPAWAHGGGVSEGDVPPSEAGNFYTFEIGIVQFDEYFWA